MKTSTTNSPPAKRAISKGNRTKQKAVVKPAPDTPTLTPVAAVKAGKTQKKLPPWLVKFQKKTAKKAGKRG